MSDNKLTETEKRFCEYFVYGDASLQWKADNCYKKCVLGMEVYDKDSQTNHKKMASIILEANKYKNKPHIKAYIHKLLTEGKDNDMEATILREMSINTLQNIAIECSQNMVVNPETGDEYVPASSRQASIRAIDSLLKIKPSIKEEEAGDSRSGQATIKFVVKPIMNDNESDE